MPETRRVGRWRTGQQSRQRIIEAARERFLRDGYERATVRGIAADAGVDVAMVYYFFGSKQGLFTETALRGPEHPLRQLMELLDEGTEQIGPRLVRRFIEHWDAGVMYEPLVAVWRGAAIQPQVRDVLHDSVAGPAAERVAAEFGVGDAELRVELVASHLAGLAFARYQLKMKPLASAAIEDVVGWVGPTLERYLTNPSHIAD
jgi:AcrR family transcriptional regulator